MAAYILLVAVALTFCLTPAAEQTNSEIFTECSSTAADRVDEIDNEMDQIFDFGLFPTKRSLIIEEHINMCQKVSEGLKHLLKFGEECCSGLTRDTVSSLVRGLEKTNSLLCAAESIKSSFAKLDCFIGKEQKLAKCAASFLEQMLKSEKETELMRVPSGCKAIKERTECVKSATDTCSNDARELIAKMHDNTYQMVSPICSAAPTALPPSQVVLLGRKMKTPLIPFIKLFSKASHPESSLPINAFVS